MVCSTYPILTEQWWSGDCLSLLLSRLGKCLDNRPAEYYFSILKQECLKQHNMAQLTFKQLQKIIADFTHFYNYDRTQSNLGNLTPIEFLISYQQQIKIAN